jgi:hypothetical protein
MNENNETVYYVYGFVRTNSCANLTCGIDEGNPPHLWPDFGDVAAIISSAARADFCGDSGDANLSNLAWIAPRAMRHQNALEEAMLQGPVLPVRFGTLFSTLDKLEAFIATNAPAISSFLTEIEGNEEWSVQGFIDKSVSEPAWMTDKRAEIHKKDITPGMAFMMEEKLRVDMKQALGDWIIMKSSELLELLALLAAGSGERRILPNEDPESKKEMVSNWAFLVPIGNLDKFRTEVERVSGECKSMGLSFELAGPWPPYSFCPNLADASVTETIPQMQEES